MHLSGFFTASNLTIVSVSNKHITSEVAGIVEISVSNNSSSGWRNRTVDVWSEALGGANNENKRTTASIKVFLGMIFTINCK